MQIIVPGEMIGQTHIHTQGFLLGQPEAVLRDRPSSPAAQSAEPFATPGDMTPSNLAVLEHAAILASAQQPLQPQLPATQFQLQPPLLPSSSQAQDNQQGGARLKRERDAQDEGGNNVSLIDLTEKKQASEKALSASGSGRTPIPCHVHLT
eukprot:994-Pelagomonas_calceolata.AAC.4